MSAPMTRTSALLLLFSAALSSASCGGGDGTIACEGICGTFLVTVSLLDASGAETSCGAAEIDKFELSFTADSGTLTTRSLPCSAETQAVGRFPAERYRVAVVAYGKDGTTRGRANALDTVGTADQMLPMNLRLVAGPPSALGASCEGGCPDGFDCVQLMLSGGRETSYCTQTCGTSTAMVKPENGDFACAAGYVAGGQPTCSIYGQGSGDVTWSCSIRCKEDTDCPSGTCQTSTGAGSLCGH